MWLFPLGSTYYIIDDKCMLPERFCVMFSINLAVATSLVNIDEYIRRINSLAVQCLADGYPFHDVMELLECFHCSLVLQTLTN